MVQVLSNFKGERNLFLYFAFLSNRYRKKAVNQLREQILDELQSVSVHLVATTPGTEQFPDAPIEESNLIFFEGAMAL